jgi:hypothetical protein
MLIADTGPVAERVRVREIDDDEGRRLVRIVRRDSGSVVIWRRAQMVLLSRTAHREASRHAVTTESATGPIQAPRRWVNMHMGSAVWITSPWVP